MTIEIITEATDLAALHTHAANHGQVLQVRLRQLCREVATTTGQPITTPQSLATGFIPAPPVPGLEPVDGPPDFSALTSAMHR